MEIDESLLLTPDESTDNPTDYKNSVKRARLQKLQNSAFAEQAKATALKTTAPVTSVSHLAPIDSYWEKGETMSDLLKGQSEYLADQQGNLAKIGNTIGQGVGTFLTATASSLGAIGGAVAGIGAEAVDLGLEGDQFSGMDIMLNNPVMQGINQIDKSIKEDLLPTYYSQEQQNSILSAATATDGINGLGFLLSAILPGAAVTKALGGVSKIGQLAKLGKLEQIADKAVKMGTMKVDEAAKLVAYGNMMKNVPAVTGAIVGRLGESAMEANGTYDQLISQGVSEEEAKKQRDNVFYGNMALAASDLAQFTRWFKPNAYERIIKQGAGYAIEKEGAKNLIIDGIKEATQEAGEEGFQYILGEGAKKDAVDKGDNFISNTLGSVGDAFTTIEGQKSMLLGAILGGGAGAAFKTMNRKEVNAQLDDAVTQLNANPSYSNNRYIVNAEGQRVINPEFIKNNAQLARLEAIKEQAIAEGDTETAELMDKVSFATLVNSRVQTNTFDDLIEELENVGQAEDFEVEQYFGKTAEGKTAKQISQEKITEAKELKKMIDGVNLIPKFQGLSIEGKGIIAQNLLVQDSLAKQINQTVSKMSAIVPQRNWQENLAGEAVEANINYKGLNPVQREELKNLEATKNELVNQYNRINSQLEGFTNSPKKIEKIVEAKKKVEEEKFEKEIEKEVIKDNKAEEKLNDLRVKAAEGSVTVSTSEGDITITSLDGQLVNAATGEPIDEDYLKDIIKQNATEDEEIIEPEITETTEIGGAKKVDTFSTSTRGHALVTKGSSSEKYADTINSNPETGEIKYTLYLPHYDATVFLANPKNTPSKENKFTFNLSLVEANEAILDEINTRRKGRKLDPLTLADLNKPEYRIIQMTMVNKGNSIEGLHLHDVEYFKETSTYEKIMSNEKMTPEEKEAKVKAEEQKIIDFRAKVITLLEQGKPVSLNGVTKSDGIVNFNPTIGKKQVLPLVDSLGSIVPEAGNANGIGVVTEVDEDDVTIEFENGVKKTGYYPQVADKGKIVFETISANGSPYVVDGITFREYNSAQLNSMSQMIMYRFFTGSNQLTNKGKTFTIFGNSTQRGLIDTLLYIGKREEAREKQLYIAKDSGSLWIGRKEFKVGSNPEQVEQALNNHLLTYMNKAKFTLGSVRNGTEVTFPEDITPAGEIDSPVQKISNFLFSGKQPLIGTNVNSEIRFINSYIDYEIDGDGNPILDTPAEKSEPVDFTENLPAKGSVEAWLKSISPTEDKKADIERRRNRNKELKTNGSPVLDGDSNSWFAYNDLDPIKARVSFKTQEEALAWIDSKYDAELAALDKPSSEKAIITPVDPELDSKLEQENNECNSTKVIDSDGPMEKSNGSTNIIQVKDSDWD